MKFESSVEILEVLACDIAARPAGAASIVDIRPYWLDTARTEEHVVIAFSRGALPFLREFVAAEQVCCSTIGWHLDEEAVVLRIIATEVQLDQLELMFGGAAE